MEMHRCCYQMQLFSVTERPYGRHLFFSLVDVITLVNERILDLDCPSIYLILIDHKALNALKIL